MCMVAKFLEISLLLPRVRMLACAHLGLIIMVMIRLVLAIVIMPVHVIRAKERREAHSTERHGRYRNEHLPTKVGWVRKYNTHKIHPHFGNGA